MGVHHNERHTMLGYSIPEAAAAIAHLARVRVFLAGEFPEVALHAAAVSYREDAIAADKRTGRFTREMTSSDLELCGLYGSVACDILDGVTCRPSTGNVREYALNLI